MRPWCSFSFEEGVHPRWSPSTCLFHSDSSWLGGSRQLPPEDLDYCALTEKWRHLGSSLSYSGVLLPRFTEGLNIFSNIYIWALRQNKMPENQKVMKTTLRHPWGYFILKKLKIQNVKTSCPFSPIKKGITVSEDSCNIQNSEIKFISSQNQDQEVNEWSAAMKALLPQRG